MVCSETKNRKQILNMKMDIILPPSFPPSNPPFLPPASKQITLSLTSVQHYTISSFNGSLQLYHNAFCIFSDNGSWVEYNFSRRNLIMSIIIEMVMEIYTLDHEATHKHRQTLIQIHTIMHTHNHFLTLILALSYSFTHTHILIPLTYEQSPVSRTSPSH